MSPEKGRPSLPGYKGTLVPAPWSRLKLTEELRVELKRIALRGCPVCKGEGHVGAADGHAHPCHCVNRPPEGAGRP